MQRDRDGGGERRDGEVRCPSIDLPGRGDAERLEDLQVLLGHLPRLLCLGVVGRHPASSVLECPACVPRVDSASGEKQA